MTASKLQYIEDLEKRLLIAKEVSDRIGEGTAYRNLGNAYYRLGKFQEAIDYHIKCLSIAKEVGDRDGEGTAYGNLGNAYCSLGKFQEAIDYHIKCLSIAKEVGDRAGEGRAYGYLGTAYCSLGKLEEAIKYYNKCLSIVKEVGDRYGEGRAYGNLGNAYCSLGKFQEAIEYYSKFLSIAKEVGDRAGEGTAYGNLGYAYHSLGNFQEAIEYHNKCLSTVKEVGNRVRKGETYGFLGSVYGSLGKFQEAIGYHNKCLSIVKEVGDRAREGTAYGNLGTAYCSLGKLEEAIKCYNKCLSIVKEVGDRVGEGTAYGNLGNAYCSLGKLEEAIEYDNKCLSIVKEVGDKANEGRAYGNSGRPYYKQGKFQEAMEYINKYLSVAKEVGDRYGEGTAYGSLGAVYSSLEKFQEAKECYQSSVKVFDIVRGSVKSDDALKISFRDLCRFSYDGLWRTLLLLDLTVEALCAAERGRAQALVDDLKIRYGLTALPLASFEPKETISHISNVFSKNKQIVFLGLDGNMITFWIINRDNKVELRRVKIEIEGRQRKDDSITFLLETTLKEIGAGVGVRCEDRSLDELTDDSSSKRGSEEEPAKTCQCTTDSLHLLHDAIIGPISDLCQGDELIIVPDGPLCLAPFSALSESIRIHTVPSLTSLKLIMDSPEDNHRIGGALLVGDPCLEKVIKEGIWEIKPKYRQLPRAKMEVDMIGKILNIQPLTGTKATKEKVLEQMTSVALVHIVAHGRKETGEIALAPNQGWENNPDRIPRLKIKIPKEEDYILKMSDVLAARLRARLVVLSCCHSGRGEVNSEGVVGIARAFLAAGARSVLASLWAISDEATFEFMKSFYQHLKDGEGGSVALHQAMKTLGDSEKFSAANYWAPFVLIGDDVRLEFENQDSENSK